MAVRQHMTWRDMISYNGTEDLEEESVYLSAGRSSEVTGTWSGNTVVPPQQHSL